MSWCGTEHVGIAFRFECRGAPSALFIYFNSPQYLFRVDLYTSGWASSVDFQPVSENVGRTNCNWGNHRVPFAPACTHCVFFCCCTLLLYCRLLACVLDCRSWRPCFATRASPTSGWTEPLPNPLIVRTLWTDSIATLGNLVRHLWRYIFSAVTASIARYCSKLMLRSWC